MKSVLVFANTSADTMSSLAVGAKEYSVNGFFLNKIKTTISEQNEQLLIAISNDLGIDYDEIQSALESYMRDTKASGVPGGGGNVDKF